MSLKNLVSKSQPDPTYKRPIKRQLSVEQSEEMMTHFTFRKFKKTDADYQAVVDVWNAVWPDEKTSLESQKHNDKNRHNKYWDRLVYEEDGRIVAYGIYCETWWSKRPGKYFINFVVLPEYRNRGIGTAYYNHVIEILQQRDLFTTLTADTREDKPEGIRFLTKRGFKQVMRYPRSILDLQAFEPKKYQGLIKKVNASGIEILNLDQLAAKADDYQRKIYEMGNEIEKDVPSPEPFTPDPFEEFQVGYFENPNLMPETVWFAVDQGQLVGTSTLWKNPDEEVLSTGLTGVLRSHRRLGVATALKATALGIAKAKGYNFVDTDNEENNPMYQLNLQLGFKPAPAYLDFQKDIE